MVLLVSVRATNLAVSDLINSCESFISKAVAECLLVNSVRLLLNSKMFCDKALIIPSSVSSLPAEAFEKTSITFSIVIMSEFLSAISSSISLSVFISEPKKRCIVLISLILLSKIDEAF